MVAGRLQEKNGFYYIVLSYTDSVLLCKKIEKTLILK